MMDYTVLSGETLTFRRTNPRSPIFIIHSIFIVGGMLAWFLMGKGPHLPLWFFIPIFIMIFFVFRVWGLLTRVTIASDGITIATPLKQRFYSWREIKIVGVYSHVNNRIHMLHPKQFGNTVVFGYKYVWFSKYPETQPNAWMFPNGYYGDFEYRKDAWELVDKYAWQYIAGMTKDEASRKTFESTRRGF